MNLFGYSRVKNKMTKFREAPSTARDPKKVKVKTLGQAIKGVGAGDFEESPVDLEEIGRAYYTDSYIRRAIDKYVGRMFKNGWELQGKNEKATEYVWTRLKLMTEASGIPTEELFTTMAHDYVLYGNAYVVKQYQKNAQGMAGIQATGYTSKQPIAAYFPLASTTVTIARDEAGTLQKYQQKAPGGGGQGIEFKPEQVCHFAYKKPTGRAYGVPYLFNVMDDVKILRQIEENVARLIYRNLFPLYMYQVGLPEPGFEAKDEEIDAVREEIRAMPMDGGIVVPERHNIKVIGSEGNALDANGYLKYFRQRVFTGLGVSDSVMGIGDTANKSTSDNQSSDMNDGVKDFQHGFAECVRNQIINELLLEGGFEPILKPEDEVLFMFSEVELDAKIKKENHVLQMFMQNAITHEEMRLELGRDPVTDEARLQANMFMAVDQGAANAGDNKDKPENQSGKQNSPGKPKPSKEALFEENANKVLTESSVVVTLTSELDVLKYTSQLEDYWNQAKTDVVNRMARGEALNHIPVLTTKLIQDLMKSRNRQHLAKAINLGFRDGREQTGIQALALHKKNVEDAIHKGSKSIHKVIEELEMALRKAEEIEDSKRIAYIESAFHANKYRLKLISKTMLFSAYNYGVCYAGQQAGVETAKVTYTERACNVCEKKQTEISLTGDWKEEIPPHHPGCECIIVLKEGN